MIGRIAARVRSLWWNLVRRERVEQALDDELRAYVDCLAAEYEEKGMPPAEARRAALVDTGGVEQVKEATRDAWSGDLLFSTARELRYAVRALRRSPMFFAIAVTTLALGIGGATAVFTVVNGSLMRPLPGVAEPESLVTVERVQSTRIIAEFSVPDALDLNERTTALTGVAGFNGTSMALVDSAGTDRAWVSFVTDNFFTVLGVQPTLGRLFGDGDAWVGTAGETSRQVVVLGHDLWRERFGASASVIGSTITLEGHTYAIIGVAPPGFIGAMTPYGMELFIPLLAGTRASPALGDYDVESRRQGHLRLVGRLAPGKDVDDAQRDLAAVAAQLAAVHPSNRDRSVHVYAGTGMTAEERDAISRVPRLLAMAVALLLLIGCSNVAGLALVRASARRRELATRLALGASRAVLVRQVTLEGVVIAVGAGLLGVAIARLLVTSATLVRTVVSLDSMDVAMDGRVLALALIASTLTAVVVSMVPAFQIFRVPPGAVLKDGGGAVRRRSRGQRALVALQVAASLVLLAAASTVFGSFQRVLRAHSGFSPEGLTDARIELSQRVSDSARQVAVLGTVLERAAAHPAVEGAALTTTVPPFQWAGRSYVFRRGEELPRSALAAGGRETEQALRALNVTISNDFFAVMRMAVLRGRTFSDVDNEKSERVAIVNQRLAGALWPGGEAIGQYLAWPSVEGPERPPLRVVGVVADTRDALLAAPAMPAMYLPFAQRPGSYSLLLLRGRGGVPVSTETIRRIVTSASPDVTVLGGRTLEDRLRDEVHPQRTASAWISVFGGIALLLTCIGIYGVVAQGVLQRTRELAVRSALGATPRGILAMVLGDGMRLAALGAVVGGVGAVLSLRVLRSMFAGVQLNDLLTAAAAAMVLAVATLAATWLPARRAARLNPADALRSD